MSREGRMGGVTIVDGTVRRPTGRWTPAVHSLLKHLEHVGFDGAPRVLGIDGDGREILTYLSSEASSRVDAPKTDAALLALGRLLRELRDALATFTPPANAVWRIQRAGNAICHNDVNPGNVVYRDGVPYALIDWDLAGPADPDDDFVRAVILFAPLVPDDVCRAWGFTDPPDRTARISRLCEGYGVAPTRSILDAAELLERRDLDELETLGRAGVSPFSTFLATGSEQALRRDLAWLRRYLRSSGRTRSP